MHQPPLPLTKDLVLIGGGHTHALVLRKWGMMPLPGARVTVINPGPTAPYSGMLPGFVAGHYDREALDIDLVKLSRFAGARVILGAAEHIDLSRREIHVAGRPPIAFDIASVDVGITSDMPRLPGFSEFATPAKPLGPFASRWHGILRGSDPVRVAVIGGGVAGVELVLAMAHALKQLNRLQAAHLIDSGKILTAIGTKAQAKLRQALAEYGVTVLEDTKIEAVTATGISMAGDQDLPCDFITGTAGARAYEWVAQTGLECENGFICTDKELRSSDPAVFAAGDCAQFVPDPRPKAGVYAVRQAPILYHNLRSALSGKKLYSYKPQNDYLKLISMGRKSALGERFGTTMAGPLVWRLKDQIDQSFMQKFKELPKMELPNVPQPHAEGVMEALGDKPACGGCGSKLGRGVLKNSLETLPAPVRSDVVSLPGDDAALLEIGSTTQVISTDHLRALTADPVIMARIAAHHALGDIWAMGAKPQAATVTAILPRLSSTLQERSMAEIMKSAQAVFSDAGAEIIGGHSSTGDELVLGFTVTGLVDHAPVTLSGARPGDVIILTKPIGSGTIMAAEMAMDADGADVAEALTQMMQSQGKASAILARAHAMTDVTGFGLAGHLLGICEASGVGAKLALGRVPVMNGALKLAEAGTRSSLFAQNREIAPYLPSGPREDLLFDPQTAGGLLAAIPKETSEDTLEQLKNAGYRAEIIGAFQGGPASLTLEG